MRRSAPPWASRSSASARGEPAAWNGYAGPAPCLAWLISAVTSRGVIQVLEGWDDEQLLTALGEAIKARDAVPSWFVQTGKNAYAWHNVDAELAQLTYDSRTDAHEMAVARSEETATIRALTFTSAHLSIELEVADGSLFGQVVPPQAGTLETRTKTGMTTAPVEETGFFTVAPIPPGPFLLRFGTTDGAYVMTGWITL